ncbi:hypothetical protein [Tumebacillus permanentifrigoris]|uniref:Bulb-type lectin domain-containing protein n=1 Tax=Tumebacillus permanentifrigoris TaxID=378543 RepID=A0A316D5U7_9BACL|nr:hypothetical protein [Tumebacillus permanentifrigoris]PWK08433.1 hypothetical protein C7459_11586 [Tumebacillus permanentifrigoris]
MNKIAKMTGSMLLALSMLQLPAVSSAFAADYLTPGQTLSHDGMITSADGRFAFDMQWDGNLVLYNQGTSLWGSGTRGDHVDIYDPFIGITYHRYAEVLRLDTIGRLRVTDTADQFTFWQADTNSWMNSHYQPPMIKPTGLVGDRLVVQSDGNCVLYDTTGNSGGSWLPVWATNTGGR